MSIRIQPVGVIGFLVAILGVFRLIGFQDIETALMILGGVGLIILSRRLENE